MIQDDYRAAIDIGTTKVCAMVGRQHTNGTVELVGIGVAPCNGLSRGTVADPAAISKAVRTAVAAASEQAGLPVRKAYVGLTGSHVESENRWKHVPGTANIRVVTEDDMNSALSAASTLQLTGGRKLLHVIPRSYAVDGIHGVRNPLGMHVRELHIQSHVITGSIDHIRRLESAVEAAGVTPAGVVVEPVASAESVLTMDEREEGVILLDIGGGTTDVSVFFDGSIAHTAVLPVGGYQFSNDLAIAFAIDYESAERFKIKHGTATPEMVGMMDEVTIHSNMSPDPLRVTRREIGQVLRERVSELFEMVKLKLDVPHLNELPLDRMVLTGGGAKLQGLQGFAKFMFQRNVRLGAPRALEGLTDEHRDPAYTAAVGIMLWGMRNLPRESHVGGPTRKLAENGLTQGHNGGQDGGGVLGGLRGWLPGKRRPAKGAEAGQTPAGV